MDHSVRAKVSMFLSLSPSTNTRMPVVFQVVLKGPVQQCYQVLCTISVSVLTLIATPYPLHDEYTSVDKLYFAFHLRSVAVVI